MSFSKLRTAKTTMTLPEEWGRPWWEMIHSAAAGATTPEKRTEFKRFMTVTVPILLPCDTCSNHLRKNIARYDINKYMGSEEQLLLWTYLIHGLVNEITGKTTQPSYHEVKLKYLPQPGGVVCTTVCAADENGEHSHTTKKISRTHPRTQQFRYK